MTINSCFVLALFAVKLRTSDGSPPAKTTLFQIHHHLIVTMNNNKIILGEIQTVDSFLSIKLEKQSVKKTIA